MKESLVSSSPIEDTESMPKKKTFQRPFALVELVGWYGAGAIVAAYALVSYEILLPESFTYQLLNLTGSAGLLVSAFSKRDFQPVFLNVVWIIIALTATVSILLQ